MLFNEISEIIFFILINYDIYNEYSLCTLFVFIVIVQGTLILVIIDKFV